jgi:MFS family permease
MTQHDKDNPVTGVAGTVGATIAKPIARTRLISTTTWMTIILSSMYGIMYLDRVNISVAAKDMMKEFSLSNVQIGLAFSAFSWPYLIGQLFGGWFAKQVGSRLTLALCGILVAISTISTGFVTGLISLFIVRLALGCGEGPAFSAATAAMRDWYPEKRFGFIQGITHSAARLGGAVAPPIVAWIIATSGWRWSFWVCGLMSVAWVAVWITYFKDDPRSHPGMTEKELSQLSARSKVTRKTRTPFLALAKRVGPVTAVDFCYGWNLWVYISWIPLYFMNRHHLDLKSSALLAGLTFFAGVVGDTIGGSLSDRIYIKTGNKRIARNMLIAASLLLSGAFLFATMFTFNISLVALLLGLAFFFLELVVGTIWAIPMDISREYAGLASGMMNFGFGLAGIISPVVFGLVIDKTGNWDIPFGCTVAICVIGAALTVFMRPDKPFIAPDSTA